MLDYIVDNEQYFLGKDKNGQPHYIKEVQDIVLKILLEIDRVCRKNNIPYALAFGSALGIHNYHGFIPWDDDADVVFNYEDLPHLLEAFKKDLGPDYVAECYEFDRRYNILQPTIKVKNKYGPTMVDYNYKLLPDHIRSCDGFFVDMVPLVGMPNAKTHAKLIRRSRRRLVSYFVQDYFFHHDPLKLKAKMKADEMKNAEEFKDAPYVCQTALLPFPSPKNNLFPREMIYPFKEYDFAGHKLYSFNDIEGFSKIFFGKDSLRTLVDGKWVDPFPKKRRKADHVKCFDFDK